MERTNQKLQKQWEERERQYHTVVTELSNLQSVLNGLQAGMSKHTLSVRWREEAWRLCTQTILDVMHHLPVSITFVGWY
jgi:ribosome-binding ATPase YchF (GTP1/OBG family)